MTHPLLAEVLAMPSSGSATNFYLDASDVGAPFATTAAQRRATLEAHINDVSSGDVLLVGEAAGWRGARQSGVPFTSSNTLGLPGPREASATVVQGTLAALGAQRRVLLWNAFPLHPHNPNRPESNRAPTTAELASGEAALRVAAANRQVVCVGGKAASSVARVIGAPDAVASAGSRVVAVRHPSFGGANQFRAEMHAIAAAWGW